MAGTTIKITVDDREVKAAFARLLAKDGGMATGALKNIGEALVESTRARFGAETAPDGSAWKPLNPEYAKGKKGPGILKESGQLENSIVYQLSGDALQVGTNKIYAAAHQFGAVIVPRDASALRFRLGSRVVICKKVTLPARPFLGISDSDRKTIIEILEDHILGAFG